MFLFLACVVTLSWSQITKSSQEDVISLKYQDKLSDSGNDEATDLHFEVKSQNLERVMDLLNKNADPNSQGRFGRTALHFAVKLQNLEIIKYFLEELGVDHNSKNGLFERTFLHDAVNLQNLPTVVYLLNRGVNPNLPDRFNETPLHRAAMWNNLPILQCLLEHGATTYSSKDEDGKTPLDYATKLEVMTYLLKYNGTSNSQYKKD
jgi:serine/threonine-protein phosphatase 6 regulatory ankyrin repeat subunit B